MKLLRTSYFTKALVAMVMVAGLLAVVPMTPANAAPACNSDNAATTGIKSGIACAKSDNQKTDIGNVFKTITNVLLFIIGAVAVIMIILGGIRYTISGGDSSQVTNAKNTILYAVIGIVVALLAYAIVNFVIDSFIK